MYTIPEQWKGVLTRAKRLSDQAVICLFPDGWSVSATGNHTHTGDYLHFGRRLSRSDLRKAERYFQLRKEEKEMLKEFADDPGAQYAIRCEYERRKEEVWED